jgi:Protein of unknown function (DUF2786)
MTTTNIEPILSKIKKLLALSTSSNPNEAALAAAKAQELLMQHNLTMSMISTQDESSYERSFIQTGKRIWRRLLVSVLARNNFCEPCYDPQTSQTILIGEAHNCEVVGYLYTYLLGQLEPMAVAAYKISLTSMHAKTWLDAFYVGAINSIGHRLEAQKQEMAAASNACKALIVSKDAELKTAFNRFYPRTRRDGSKRVRSVDGYQAGQEAGQRVALHRGIEA